MSKDGTSLETYWSHVSDAASCEAYGPQPWSIPEPEEPLDPEDASSEPPNSAETLPEQTATVDFASFTHDYPEKIFPLLRHLRPEFQEYFIEYYVLGKPQTFLGETHGCVQTRVWQTLRIIEQTLGAFLILGTSPSVKAVRETLQDENLEKTPYGSLASLIESYAHTQSYKMVAEIVKAPTPAIRRIFRPAIQRLLASSNVRAIAIGAYLRNLTHQASLTGQGLSRRNKKRTQRVKYRHFVAPPLENTALFNFGRTEALQDTPWCMFELTNDVLGPRHGRASDLTAPRNYNAVFIQPLTVARLYETLKRTHVFGKRAAQIFAPTDANGSLTFGYVFARSIPLKRTKALLKVHGITDMAMQGSDPVTIANEEVQTLIRKSGRPPVPTFAIGDFVQIQTGEAAHYCGTIIHKKGETLTVEINFPTERQFIVRADASSLNLLENIPASGRTFWGVKPEEYGQSES